MGKQRVMCDCEVIHEDILSKVKCHMPKDTGLYDLADFFKVFGDSTRMQILWALDINEMCVCDIAVLLGVTKSAISHQLRYLKEAHLVKNRKEGKVIFYSLHDEHVKNILEMGFEHINEGVKAK